MFRHISIRSAFSSGGVRGEGYFAEDLAGFAEAGYSL